eukprot:TRINITY_DN27252_c0_g1_i1.p1 TRINITY_DN27252_c0_g1~~TRINITY_DN27252_c0_g1_i1.p1  ORF type:complete len:594 (+),score=95.07 TRINITY_DN27252_c0_g1_i1:131-1783(+)
MADQQRTALDDAGQYWLQCDEPWLPQVRPNAPSAVTALGAVDIGDWRLGDGDTGVVIEVSPCGDFRLGRPGEPRTQLSPWASTAEQPPLLCLPDGSLVGARRTPSCTLAVQDPPCGEEVATVSFSCPGGSECLITALPGALRFQQNGEQDPQDWKGPVNAKRYIGPRSELPAAPCSRQRQRRKPQLLLRLRGLPGCRFQAVPRDPGLLGRIRSLCRAAGVPCQIPDELYFFDESNPLGDYLSRPRARLRDGRELPLRVPRSSFLDTINDWPSRLGFCPPAVAASQRLVDAWRGCIRCRCEAFNNGTHHLGAPTIGDIAQCKQLARIFVQELLPGWQLPKLLWFGRAQDLPTAAAGFPADYVAKSTHGFRNASTGEMVTPQWLAEFFETCDVLVEELLVDAVSSSNASPRDIKAFVFGGQLQSIEVFHRAVPAGCKLGRKGIVSADWSYRDVQYSAAGEPYRDTVFFVQGVASSDQLSPALCDALRKRCSEIGPVAGRPVFFLRVDWYETPQGLIFGEFCAHPGGGKHHLPAGLRLLDRWTDEMLAAGGEV